MNTCGQYYFREHLLERSLPDYLFSCSHPHCCSSSLLPTSRTTTPTRLCLCHACFGSESFGSDLPTLPLPHPRSDSTVKTANSLLSLDYVSSSAPPKPCYWFCSLPVHNADTTRLPYCPALVLTPECLAIHLSINLSKQCYCAIESTNLWQSAYIAIGQLGVGQFQDIRRKITTRHH